MPRQSAAHDARGFAARVGSPLAPKTPASIARYLEQIPTRGLLIRERWLGHIYAGDKDWEIRSAATAVRGPIALIQSKSGLITGLTTIVGVEGPLSRADLRATVDRHQVPAAEVPHISYAHPHAWVLRQTVPLPAGVPYAHPSGAVIFVTLTEDTRRALARALKALGRIWG